MARMHSRKRGVSGSTRPARKQSPSWVKYKTKEVELLIVKYSKEGLTPSKVGIRLRDIYGIPDIKLITKRSITEILKERKLQKDIPEDMMALIKKSIFVRKHLEENKHDQPAKRGLTLTDSKIHRLSKYYKKTGRLPTDWKFDPKRASFYLE
ncbi:30S ribosomal protein S15 [Candidatus Woesearchaeota archaeon]|nr:30S ribosomal protein S15 [Candidatus Woesearchaeota archaeon]